MRNPHHSSWPAVAAAVLGAAVLAGCGVAAPPRHTAGASGGPLLTYARCMRAHGVSNFPDPASAGGLIIRNSIDTNSPAFRAAQHACGTPGPPGGGGRDASESRKLQLLAVARCMRAHGLRRFADPTTSPPPPTAGNAIGGGGWYLALGTAQERQSPAYSRAAAACNAAPMSSGH
jgi:hypothetical protein